jgi:hypothetical protein
MAGNKKARRKPGKAPDINHVVQTAYNQRIKKVRAMNKRIHKRNDLPMGHPVNQHKIDGTFVPFERWLKEQEDTGTMLVDDEGRPVIRDPDDEVFVHVAPQLMNMAHVFDMLVKIYTFDKQPPGVRALAMKLIHDLPLDQSDVDDARTAFNWMRKTVAKVTPSQWSDTIELVERLDKKEAEAVRAHEPA